MNIAATKKVEELLILSLEGVITEEEVKTLNHLVKSDPEMMRYCVRFLMTVSNLQRSAKISAFNLFDFAMDSSFDMELWQSLAEHERTAPAIEIPKERPKREPVKMLKVEKVPRRVNKFSLSVAILSAAAMLLMILYVQIMPPSASSVATLTDSINAEWADSGDSLSIGSELFNDNKPMQLLKGVVRIEFDYGAEVILEAPAEIELESSEQMTINYGQLYAQVPEQAAGFTVDTPGSKVIDIGTEFGVKVDFDGSTDVHMFKGRASLVPGRKGEKKQGMELVAGQAKAVIQTGQVWDIGLEKEAFVRKIDSEAGLLWRGKDLNLADIVGGGDGFGTGRIGQGINPLDGSLLWEVNSVTPLKPGGAEYRLAADSKFIEGVFVPDGGLGPVMISSLDHLSDCPDTSGFMNVPVANGLSSLLRNKTIPEISFRGQRCGTKDNPAILLHSNGGITFDLQEMRQTLPGITIARFMALAGISETARDLGTQKDAAAEIWVILDGKTQFRQRVRANDPKAYEVNIPLDRKSRFLTLMTTDGGDGIDSDWCLFVKPMLVLE